ncbi:MAG TPA: hypothetical protein H9903_02980 [Candidatus Aquabacterium excrementipullorum]|nr:hypothetical protein [Candidatus Aquabacterium excrementipullorum]
MHQESRRSGKHYSLWQVFRWPLLIGVASAIGLVSALVADGVWDALSWALLALPLVVGIWYSVRRS